MISLATGAANQLCLATEGGILLRERTQAPTKRELDTMKIMVELERERPGAWSMLQVSQRLAISQGSSFVFMDRLIGKGLARKTASARYALTDAAASFLPKARGA